MDSPKRTQQVNVRLAPEDMKLLRRAAERQWPGMPLSASTLLLTLAKRQAEMILKAKRPKEDG